MLVSTGKHGMRSTLEKVWKLSVPVLKLGLYYSLSGSEDFKSLLF